MNYGDFGNVLLSHCFKTILTVLCLEEQAADMCVSGPLGRLRVDVWVYTETEGQGQCLKECNAMFRAITPLFKPLEWCVALVCWKVGFGCERGALERLQHESKTSCMPLSAMTEKHIPKYHASDMCDRGNNY